MELNENFKTNTVKSAKTELQRLEEKIHFSQVSVLAVTPFLLNELSSFC